MATTSAVAENGPGLHDLTRGPIMRTLLLFALPQLGSSVVQSLNGSINAIWVGRLLGEGALTATANANLIMFLLLSAVFGLGMAATILVGQSIGRRDIDLARRVVGTAATSFLLLSIVIGAAGYLLSKDLLALMGTPPAARDMATEYLQVIFLAMPLLYLMTLLTMTQRGAGDSRTPLLFMIMTAVIDVVLNPLLILGWGPIPRMGIAGSALATLIGNLAGFIALITYIYARNLPLRLRGSELRYLVPDRALLWSIAGRGVPIGLQIVLMSVSALVMISFVNQYGIDTAAAYGVAAQLWTYIQMPALAVGAAVSSMAAQNIGAGLWTRVAQITRAGIILNVVLSGLLILCLALADRPALALFLGADSAALPIARHINLITSWSFLLFGVMMVTSGTVRANGAVWVPLINAAFSLLAVRIGFVLLFRPALGADAIWWSLAVGFACAAILSMLYYKYGGWRRSDMGLERAATELHAAA